MLAQHLGLLIPGVDAVVSGIVTAIDREEVQLPGARELGWIVSICFGEHPRGRLVQGRFWLGRPGDLVGVLLNGPGLVTPVTRRSLASNGRSEPIASVAARIRPGDEIVFLMSITNGSTQCLPSKPRYTYCVFATRVLDRLTPFNAYVVSLMQARNPQVPKVSLGRIGEIVSPQVTQ